MSKTHMRRYNALVRMAGTGLALLLALFLVVRADGPRGSAGQAAQVKDGAVAAMALTYDSLEAILKDLKNDKFDQGVGAPLALEGLMAFFLPIGAGEIRLTWYPLPLLRYTFRSFNTAWRLPRSSPCCSSLVLRQGIIQRKW